MDMEDKPNEVIEVDDDDEGKRSKSVVRSPWPAGHKLIGPAGATPRDEVRPVILRVLKLFSFGSTRSSWSRCGTRRSQIGRTRLLWIGVGVFRRSSRRPSLCVVAS